MNKEKENSELADAFLKMCEASNELHEIHHLRLNNQRRLLLILIFSQGLLCISWALR